MEFELESGGTILVWSETASPDTGPVTRGIHDADERVVERAERSFEAAIAQIQPAAEVLLARFRDRPRGPQGVSIEFGVGLHAQAGAFLVGASGDANFKVTLTWKLESPSS
ncbi:MAG TPA: CU044_2847 family protein [Acidimicrobiia bacterium]|nr:CU044_2847 family protein [Acidimicrobiia bacterium]